MNRDVNDKKCVLPWGKPSISSSLELEDITRLKRQLAELAANTNVISTSLTHSEVNWIEENVCNCHLIRVTDDTRDGTIWVVIGKDKDTATNYYKSI